MKDIVITPAQIKNELIALLISFIVGFLANVGAIIYYKSDFAEVFTSLPYVLVFALVIYLLRSVIKIMLYSINRILSKRAGSK